MAAEKLTKARLAQLIILLILLVGAFFWRSEHYQHTQSITCYKARCPININGQTVELLIQDKTPATNDSLSALAPQISLIPDNKLWQITHTQINGTLIISIKAEHGQTYQVTFLPDQR